MSWCLSWSTRQKEKKKPTSYFKQPGGSNSLLLREQSAFLFYSGLQLIGWGTPTLEKAIFFTPSTNLSVNLIPKHPHRNTQKNVWTNIWAPHGQSSWHIKLAIHLNYQLYPCTFFMDWVWHQLPLLRTSSRISLLFFSSPTDSSLSRCIVSKRP